MLRSGLASLVYRYLPGAPWACSLALAAASVSRDGGPPVHKIRFRGARGPFIRHEAHCLLSPSYFQSVYAGLQMNPARQMRGEIQQPTGANPSPYSQAENQHESTPVML
jgi:hypothetical protein